MWDFLPITNKEPFSEKALDALIEEHFLICGQIFRVQCLHTGHRILSVQKLIFALAHLVKGQELHTRKSDLTQERRDSLSALKSGITGIRDRTERPCSYAQRRFL